MSYESTVEAPSGLFTKIRQALFGSPQRSSQYAHPWTAYSPANFQAKPEIQTYKKMETTARALVICPVRSDHSTATSLVAQPKPIEVIELVELPTEPVRCNAENVGSLPAPAKLQLIENQTVEASAPALPALACASGQDFQLAARLRSVSILNRVSAVQTAKPAVKRSGLNRPVPQVAAKKRGRRVEPPAVRRRTRVTAEIIQLKVALARAEFRQARASKVA